MNKVTYKEEPLLFDEITEFAIDSIQDHRRGSGFWREDIIEFKEEHKKYFPDIENFEQYLGTWKTNQVYGIVNMDLKKNFQNLQEQRKKK